MYVGAYHMHSGFSDGNKVGGRLPGSGLFHGTLRYMYN